MKTLSILAAAFVLAACASYSGYGLRPGIATVDDVRRTMGPPAEEFSNPDGSRELVYPHGPMGTQTFIAYVDPRGLLSRIEQVLDDDHLQRVRPGLTAEQVRRMIGPPGDTTELPRLHEAAWGYRYVDTWGYLCEFSVTFNAKGAVVSTFSRRLERGDRRD